MVVVLRRRRGSIGKSFEIEESVLEGHGSGKVTSWNKLVARKVNNFVWRLRLGRILVRKVLDRIGMDLDSILCLCCQEVIELVDHCIIWCKLVEIGWGNIFIW